MNTSLKTCFKCGAEKPLTAFYPHKRMKDGHLNKCKECAKLDVLMRYNSPDGRAKIVEYERQRFRTPHRKAKVREYARRRDLRCPYKTKARTAVANAVRAGKLIRKPCEACGALKSQAHHTDYSKPLAVRWFCFKHHREIGHGQTVTSI